MEQRRHRRLPASILIAARTDGVQLSDPIKDISLGGAHVVTRRPLPVGTASVFALQLPHQVGAIEVKGHVVWSSGDAMGVAFEAVEPRLSSFVDRLERDAARL